MEVVVVEMVVLVVGMVILVVEMVVSSLERKWILDRMKMIEWSQEC